MKISTTIAIGIACAIWFHGTARAASDPRFFGTYCGVHQEQHGSRTTTIHVSAAAEYRESAQGNGLVTGRGNLTFDGNTFPFVFSGAVRERGRLRGSAIVGNREPTFAEAVLHADGNTVTLRGLDRTFVLSKDQCGNDAPRVAIRKPVAGTLPWGDTVMFSAAVTDREDAAFPRERLAWASDRDGSLGNGLALFKNDLSPGRHEITFSATDSGGRSASARVLLSIENTRPNQPVIQEPAAGNFYEGLEITFRGRANDREDGNLTGPALVWSSNRDGRLGAGNVLIGTLTPGDHTISLTASDRAGLSNTATSRVSVRSRPAGNVPPAVAITAPMNHYAMGDNECSVFVAQAADLEDGRLSGSSLVWRDSYRSDGRERTSTIGTGASLTVCDRPAPSADTRHVISVTATDSGGLSSTNSIVIYIIQGGLI